MPAYLVLGLVFSIAVAVFAVQNATRVDITLVFWQLKSISLVLVILGSALIGALTAGLFGAVNQLKLKINLRNNNAQLESQGIEIEYLQRKLAKLEVKEKDTPPVSGGKPPVTRENQ